MSMVYKKDQIERQALAAIKKHNIKFVTHLVAFLPCSHATFYNKGLDKLDSIKELIENNRTGSKVKALNRWESSSNPTLEVAFYKLIGDDNEVERLSGTRQKHEVAATVEHNITGEIALRIEKAYGRNDGD